jgi:hypothetical protein
MIELPTFPPYSTSPWDYLGDIPYMPSAGDRELLKKKAAGNPVHARRVQIWDYFFRPEPGDVGKPIQRELTERRTQAASHEAESTRRLRQSLDALARLEKTRQDELAAVEAQLLAIQTETAARERAQARKRIITGAILGGVGLLTELYYLRSVKGPQSEEGCVGCFWVIWILLGITAFSIGASLAYSGSRKLTPERIQAIVASQQQRVRESWAQRDIALNGEMESERVRIASEREILDRLVPHLRSRVEFLERSLQKLLDQLPAIPTEDEVEAWLSDDLQECREEGEEQLGVAGRTIDVLGTKEPFRILSPAEIQDPSLIPRMYSRSTNPDGKKHLHARRFGTTADGRAVQHYGVFHLELLFITDAVLARYSVFFDFIRGERVAERAPQQHFADMVQQEMKKEYRQILVDGKEVDLDMAPSLILSLSNGDRVAITLTSPEYFAAVGAAAVARGDDDATRAAENALKAITEKINEAKRNLEVGQIARMKEAERKD